MTATQKDMIAELQRTNAELRRERDERHAERDAALAQNAAMAEILAVINRSPGDPVPVFEAILENAHQLCDAETGALTLYHGDHMRCIATHGLPDHFVARLKQPFPIRPGLKVLLDGARYTHILDIRAVDWPEEDIVMRGLVAYTNTRTRLTVALRKDNQLLGTISGNRPVVRPFSEQEIVLLESFAAQAVIAMENARLLGELRTALDTTQATLRELKVAQANLIQAEKMASLGQLTAGIAHEIRNPLNFVNNFAILSVDLMKELMEAIAGALEKLDEDQKAEVEDVTAILTSNLQKITEHGKRADGIVKAMLEHSRGASGERREVDINQLTEEALNLAYHGARASNDKFDITLERDFRDAIAPIELNPQDMTRVLLNLFSNGFYAASQRSSGGGQPGFNPTLRVMTRATGDTVEIRVRDNGIGIPAEIRDKLFQPFFTTKPSGQGTGLGLSITYDIVTKAHGGTIDVDSEVDQFTEFVVTLPRKMFANEADRA